MYQAVRGIMNKIDNVLTGSKTVHFVLVKVPELF